MLVLSIGRRVGEEMGRRRGGGGRPENAFGGGEREVDGGKEVDERETEEF